MKDVDETCNYKVTNSLKKYANLRIKIVTNEVSNFTKLEAKV